MKVLLDTCVIYPTVMREMLLGVAAQGAFEPVWSERILEEFSRASIKLGPDGQAQALGEIEQLRARWPNAIVTYSPSLLGRLWLPDKNDVHVLAAAIAGSADVIVTMNAKDFPRNILAEEGLSRVDPDQFLFGIYQAQPELIEHVGAAVLKVAQDMSGQNWDMRGLMKKARLPRVGKVLTRA